MHTRRSRQPSLFLVIPATLALGWGATVAADDDDQKFPATGQTSCWDSSGAVINCTGTGHDGDIQAGATLRYKDNRNGTITDRNTGLVWEKKDDNNAGGIHDKDKEYSWDNAFAVHVAALNNTCANNEGVDCSVNGKEDCEDAGVDGKCGFAGKRDWRLPNVKELQSIVNYRPVGVERVPQQHHLHGLHGADRQLYGGVVLLVVYYLRQRPGLRVAREFQLRQRGRR